ncbi:MAG: hypothetical protein R3288_14745 [Woeseiaceae bacterium]|nr:hypothetical protein [Woeseiaceae bacterium]
MYYRKTLAFVAAIGLATNVFAGDERHMSMSIAVIDDATHEEVRVDLDDETLGFRLEDMQVGENRAVVDKNGQNVLITREENGFKFDVDGKTIRTPLHRAHGGGEYDVVIDALRAESAEMPHKAPLPPLPLAPPLPPGSDGIAVISAEPISEETQRAIEELLRAEGHDADVHFVDRSAAHARRHEIRVVKKRTDVTQ